MYRIIAKRSVAAIIPAAGSNARLEGKVAPFLKPTLLINGQPLIIHALQYAHKCDIDNAFIVTSPHNANVLASLSASYDKSTLNYILQPKPVGIIDAIRRCVKFIDEDWTLILCADNVYQEDPVNLMAWTPLSSPDDTPYFASRELSKSQSKRFTTYEAESSLPFRPAHWPGKTKKCWIGPLLLPTQLLAKAIQKSQTMEDVLNTIHLTRRIEPFPMQCSDMGIPEELT